MSASGSSNSSVGVVGKIAGREKSIGKIHLNAVDPHKAVGSDQVLGVLLKSCSTVFAGPLAKIFNGSLSAGYVRNAFKPSHIRPLFKSGDVSAAKNIRPVSLLPIVSRILECFVKQQLTTYLSENGLFSESQFANRRQRSTEDAVALSNVFFATETSPDLKSGLI